MNNLSAKSQISINYIIKVIRFAITNFYTKRLLYFSSVSESLIFIILGVMLVNERSWFWNDWHMIFSTTALLLCIVARFLGDPKMDEFKAIIFTQLFLVVFVLSNTLNHFTYGYRCISIKEQIIMVFFSLKSVFA